jgi:hypothetical protein
MLEGGGTQKTVLKIGASKIVVTLGFFSHPAPEEHQQQVFNPSLPHLSADSPSAQETTPKQRHPSIALQCSHQHGVSSWPAQTDISQFLSVLLLCFHFLFQLCWCLNSGLHTC